MAYRGKIRQIDTLIRSRNVVIIKCVTTLILIMMVMASEDVLGDETDNDDWKEWIYDLMSDSDTEFYLYSWNYVGIESQFHFSKWFENIFWVE